MSNQILQESASSYSIKPPLPKLDRERRVSVGPSPTITQQILKLKSKYQSGPSRAEPKLVQKVEMLNPH